MAKPTTNSWSKMTIWVGDGASPEVFTNKSCAMTTKGFVINSETSDSNVPDCDDPDLVGWIERETKSNSAQITGSGTMAEENFPFYRDWKLSGEAKNVRVVCDFITQPGYFEGSFLLTNLEMNGNQDDGKIQRAMTFLSNGPVVWVDAE